MDRSVRDRLADMALVGLDEEALVEKCRNDQNDRFRSAGIEARAPQPDGGSSSRVRGTGASSRKQSLRHQTTRPARNGGLQ